VATVTVQILPPARILQSIPQAELLKRLYVIGFRVEARAKQLTNGVLVGVVTGRLSGSITTVASVRNGVPVVLVGTNVEYGWWVHEGTRPHWPPRDAIARWLAAKGEDPGAALRVQRAIARRGTPPRPFLRQALEEVGNFR